MRKTHSDIQMRTRALVQISTNTHISRENKTEQQQNHCEILSQVESVERFK